MADITNPKLLYLKGALFVVTGLLAAGLVILETQSWRITLLLVIAIWCFARAYYFAFYVIEHYIDPGFRFAGLWSFVCYVWGQKKTSSDEPMLNNPADRDPEP